MRNAMMSVQQKAACVFIVFTLLLVFLSFMAVADNPPAAPSSAPAASSSSSSEPTSDPSPEPYAGTSRIPRCVGGDINNLRSSVLRKCLQYKDQFEQYGQSSGIFGAGGDLLFLFVTAGYESGCRSRLDMEASEKASVRDDAPGGILQVDRPCLCSVKKTVSDCPVPQTGQPYCDTIQKEIDEGTKELKGNFDHVYGSSELRGREALWMIWLEYNRGIGTAKRALNSMSQGMTIQQAADEACDHYYSNRRINCNDDKYGRTRERFGCPNTPGNPTCSNGKTCSYNFFCKIEHEDVGIHYSDIRWHEYIDACEEIGGHLVDSGAPLAITEGISESVGDVLGAMGPEFRPTHPYFTVPYSVNPSFSTEIPYDFSIYDTMPGYINRLERCRDDIDCIVQNASIIEDENPDFDWILQYGGEVVSQDDFIPEIGKWQAYCETPEQHAVNSIAEAIDNCGRSQDNDCVCKYTLPIPIVPVEAMGMFGQMVSSAANLLGLEFLGFGEHQEWEERALELRRQGNGVRISVIPEGSTPAQLVQGVHFKSIDDSLEAEEFGETLAEAVLRAVARTTSFVLGYKPEDAGQKLDIYKDNRGNITIYPDGHAPSTENCEVNNKMVKFCIVQNKTFLAYSQAQDRMGIQQLVLKFAYLFRSEVTDVRGFQVKDAKMLSNTSLLVWEPMQGVDLNFYKIYYSTDERLATDLRTASPASLEPPELRDRVYENEPLQLFVDSKEDKMVSIDALDNPVCSVSGSGTCSLEYEITTRGQSVLPTPLSPGMLYYSAVDDKFFYFMPDVLNEESYFFSITATDMNGDESPSFNMPVQGSNQASRDDVPPALAVVHSAVIVGDDVVMTFGEVTQDITGGLLEAPANKYKIYCFQDATTVEVDLGAEHHIAFMQVTDSFTSSDISFSMPLAEFIGGCGFTQSPQAGRIVVAAAKGIGDMSYDGNLTMAFSPSIVLAVPETFGP